jgi:hypothetical protein
LNFDTPLRRRAALMLALAGTTPLRTLAQGNTSALVIDSADGGGPGGGLFFMLAEIDGKAVADTSLSQSVAASRGRGAHMVVRPADHAVPAGKVTLTLWGTQRHAAPIQTIFRSVFQDGDPEVKGTVQVELSPGMRYRVNGVLDAYRREIWLADADGREVPGSRVTTPPNPELVRLMDGAVYTRTNLHYENDWISEVPWLQQPIVPVGSRIKVVEWSKHKANVLIDGRKMRLGVDYSRDAENIQQFVARVTTPDDPKLRLATYPEPVRNAIRAGRVMPGMTREQAMTAIGRPRVDYVPDLNASEWRYQALEQEELFLVFDDAGQLKEIDASRRSRLLVQYDMR